MSHSQTLTSHIRKVSNFQNQSIYIDKSNLQPFLQHPTHSFSDQGQAWNHIDSSCYALVVPSKQAFPYLSVTFKTMTLLRNFRQLFQTNL